MIGRQPGASNNRSHARPDPRAFVRAVRLARPVRCVPALVARLARARAGRGVVRQRGSAARKPGRATAAEGGRRRPRRRRRCRCAGELLDLSLGPRCALRGGDARGLLPRPAARRPDRDPAGVRRTHRGRHRRASARWRRRPVRAPRRSAALPAAAHRSPRWPRPERRPGSSRPPGSGTRVRRHATHRRRSGRCRRRGPVGAGDRQRAPVRGRRRSVRLRPRSDP